MGRKSSIINLTAEDREYLEMQTRARTIQAQTVSRARILLLKQMVAPLMTLPIKLESTVRASCFA